MAWFKRTDKGIQTPTEAKRDTPKGLWYKSPTGKIVDTEELQANYYVSPEDDYHVRIGSREYFSIIFDDKFNRPIDVKRDDHKEKGTCNITGQISKNACQKIAVKIKYG